MERGEENTVDIVHGILPRVDVVFLVRGNKFYFVQFSITIRRANVGIPASSIQLGTVCTLLADTTAAFQREIFIEI